MLKRGGEWLEWVLDSGSTARLGQEVIEVCQTEVLPFLKRFSDLRECVLEWTRDPTHCLPVTQWDHRYYAVATSVFLGDWSLADEAGQRLSSLARTLAASEPNATNRQEIAEIEGFLAQMQALRAQRA